MDSDTRHELKKNELAEALAQLRDWNSPSTRYTLLGIAIIVVLAAAWKGWSYTQKAALEAASARLGAIQVDLSGEDQSKLAPAVSQLRTLIEETSHPGLNGSARLMLARALIDEASGQPERRQAAISEAVGILDQVLRNDKTPPTIEAAALFAVGSNYESLASVDESGWQAYVDKATAAYQKLVTEPRFKGTPYVGLAADRLETLEELRTPVAFLPGNPPPPPAPATQAALPGPIGPPAPLPMAPEQAEVATPPAPAPEQPPTPAPAPEQPPAPAPEEPPVEQPQPPPEPPSGPAP